MVYFCQAAECWSSTQKKPSKYPFMANVTWVKWPKDQTSRNRWIKLMRRADKMNLNRNSRVCSRHFDSENINKDGQSSTDPKYFAWNNWGKPLNPRRRSSIDKLESSTQRKSIQFEGSSDMPKSTSILKTCNVLDVGREDELPDLACNRPLVGKMRPLEEKYVTPHPADHDYIIPRKVQVVSIAVQTEVTHENIVEMEDTVKRINATTSKDDSPSRDLDSTANLMACVLESDERVNFYTGIDSRALLNGVYDLIKGDAGKIKYWTGCHSSQEKKYEKEGYARPGPKRHLSIYQEFVMTLMRLRLNLPLLVLADMFNVGTTLVTRTTQTWINFLHQLLVPALLYWPSQEQVRSQMPLDFQIEYPKTRCVIDCTEFFIDRPSNKKEQYATFSSYKHHNTYKALIAVNPNGCFSYISDFWSGNVSDKYITEHCGIIDLLDVDDDVMADRGFQIEDILSKKNARLVAPPFTRKSNNGKGKRLNVSEIRKTKTIARLRIHVERAIQRIKTFRILKHQIPSSLQNVASMIVKVVAALCNLKGPLFYAADEQQIRAAKAIKRRKPVKRLQKK